MDERRRAERISTAIPARLLLQGGGSVEGVIRNVGELGVLMALTDLEHEIREGQRVLLEHPRIVDGVPQGGPPARSAAAVVRVDLDLEPGAIVRHVALYFDGGPRPSGT